MPLMVSLPCSFFNNEIFVRLNIYAAHDRAVYTHTGQATIDERRSKETNMEVFTLIMNEWKKLCRKGGGLKRKDRRYTLIRFTWAMQCILPCIAFFIVLYLVSPIWLKILLSCIFAAIFFFESLFISLLNPNEQMQKFNENATNKVAFCRQLQESCEKEVHQLGLTTCQAFDLARKAAETMLNKRIKFVDIASQIVTNSFAVTFAAVVTSLITGILGFWDYSGELLQSMLPILFRLFIVLIIIRLGISAFAGMTYFVRWQPSNLDLEQFIQDMELAVALAEANQKSES